MTGNLAILKKNISHFGYSDIYKFAADQATVLTLGKIEEYKNTILFFQKKYSMDYKKFKKHLDKSDTEEFEKEDELMEWRFAIECIEMYEKELKSIGD